MSNVGFSESPPSKTSAVVALVVQSPGLDETGNIFALDSGEAMRLQSEDFPEPLFPTRRRDLRRQPPPLNTSSTVLCLFESVEGVSGSGARLNSEHDHQNISIHCLGNTTTCMYTFFLKMVLGLVQCLLTSWQVEEVSLMDP